MARVRATHITDPGCPFGFNAQRQELQLMWHYGHAAEIERRMIVLTEKTVPFEERGLSPAMVARGRERLSATYGMPMGSEAATEAPATIDACRAYVGARMHAPDRSLALLRGLRRRAHSDQQRLDELESSIAGVLLRLSALELARPQGLRPVFTTGEVDRLMRAANRIHKLGDGVVFNSRNTDVAIEIARSEDGSVVVFPALPASA